MRSARRPPLGQRRRAWWHRLALLVACLCLAWRPGFAAEASPVRILLIHASDLELPSVARQDRITREAIAAAVARPVEFYSESLDRYRVPRTENERRFVAYLADKYEARRPHLIVAHGPLHDFLQRQGGELWPDVPRMLVGAGGHRVRSGELPKGIPYTAVELDVLGTALLALQLQPQAARVVLVAGTSAYDRDALQRARRDLQALQGRVTVDAISDASVPQIESRLTALDGRTIVVLLTVLTDARGYAPVGTQLTTKLSGASAAPIYSIYDTLLGLGIVGGKLIDREAQVPAIGEIARRLLDGEPAASLTVQAPVPGRCAVDLRQIRRWNIDERRIPSNCQVLFREPSFWERYRGWVLAFAGLALLQTAWLVAWTVQRRRRRQAERLARERTLELAHAARLGTVGGLMASITHEISQPLMSILTNAAAGERMLASGQPDIEEIRSILADIRSDDARAAAVISHLREFLKKRELAMQPVQVNDVVARALRIVQSAARKHDVTIATALEENLPEVLGDAIHLEQVVLNLALNGIEAMSRDDGVCRGTLTLKTSTTRQGDVEVAVSDDGCGIPASKLSRLFEPFYSTKPDGMGIGLAIAQTLVDAHGGRIWAESEGRGATFRFTVPSRDRAVDPPAGTGTREAVLR